MQPLQPTLYALNVGRGDSFFLELPGEDRARIVLIDGGDRPDAGEAAPVRLMRDRGWPTVDLLVLTHIHPDHLMGLLDVAAHFPVAEAVMPYPEFDVKLGEFRHPKAVQTAELFQAYSRLLSLLKKQQTRLVWRPPFGERAVWRFGEYRFRHLDPTDSRHLKAYEVIRRLLAGSSSAEEQERLCVSFDGLSNGDSSVWLLERNEGDQWFLFGADALLPNWERILEREPLRPSGLKIAHHGMPDAWNEQLLSRLRPDWLLITNHEAEYQIFKDRWERLAASSGSKLVVTGSPPETDYWVSRLPSFPVRMEFG